MQALNHSHQQKSNQTQAIIVSLPLNSPKHYSSSARPTSPTTASTPNIPPQRGNGNPSRKPKDHSDGLDCEDSPFVRKGREASGCNDEVGDGEEGPDRGEQHEVYTGRCPALVEWAVPSIDD